MLEIYNEKIRDLLIEKKDSENLHVRQNQQGEIFVEGLSTFPVDSYEQIE